jgi:hypothetical protein
MSRTLTRPMFRKGGEVKRSNYMGGGIKAVRPRYMGGGMTGIMSGITPDAGLTPRSGFQEGTKPSFFRSILNAINPTSGDVVQRIQKREEEPSLIETVFAPAPLEFRTQAEADAYLASNPEYSGEIKILNTGQTINTKIPTKTPEGSTANIPGTPIVPNPDAGTLKQKITVDKDDTPSDQDTIKSYIDMFQQAFGDDEETTNREKYLELARFGANVLAQPGGDLVGTIGKAASSSIEGLAKTAAAKKVGDREIKLAAVKTALSKMDPTELEKRYDFLKDKFPNKSDIEIANMLISGETGKLRTQESRIQSISDALKGTMESAVAEKVARSIEESGIGYSKFSVLPKDKKGNIKPDTNDGYYYDQDNGTLYQIEKGEVGVLGAKTVSA